MARIGKRQVIGTFDLLIPEGETASFSVRTNDEVASGLPVTVEFKDTPDSQRVETKPGGVRGGVRIVFFNWKDPLGTALRAPSALADTPDTTFEFMATNFRIGGTNRLTIQFLKSKKA